LAASGEPGHHRRQVLADDGHHGGACRFGLAASPRACSSITRSSMDATKVTPAALIACRSQGASSQGSVVLRTSQALLASTAAVSASGVPWNPRTAAAGSSSSSRWAMVGASRDRSMTCSGVTRTSTAPWPSTQARPTSTAWLASAGSVVAGWRLVCSSFMGLGGWGLSVASSCPAPPTHLAANAGSSDRRLSRSAPVGVTQ
jgi:hypothetical protein